MCQVKSLLTTRPGSKLSAPGYGSTLNVSVVFFFFHKFKLKIDYECLGDAWI